MRDPHFTGPGITMSAKPSSMRATKPELHAQLQAAEQAWFPRAHGDAADLRVAYFCAEFGLTTELPVFSGGLGVLAGDHLKSASDLGVPLVAVGLFYRQGYFTQHVNGAGEQEEVYGEHDPALMPLVLQRDAAGEPLLVEFPILDHVAYAQVWRHDVGSVQLYLLDTDVAQNRPENRRITDRLYGGDNEQRLRQEIVLGIGGMRMLHALGITPTVIHLNEGHAAFAAVERARLAMPEGDGHFLETARGLTAGVVFTTHTPVPAGHDMFPVSLMERYLGGYVWHMREPWRRFLALGRHDATDDDEPFNMTLLALRMSGRRNGVSRLHGEVSRRMWMGVWPGLTRAEVPIGHITNGVHLPTWVSPVMDALYTLHVGSDWRDVVDDVRWQRAAHIPLAEIWAARRAQRHALVEYVRRALGRQVARRGEPASWTSSVLNDDTLTIVFARRFATYKRATLLFSQPERLEKLLATGRVQFIFAGKAHPRDEPGQELIRDVFNFAARPGIREHFVFLEDYDVDVAAHLVSGADVWLNVPRRPYEASGTSGMKAAANGALNLSIPDGWWAEAWTDHNRLQHPIGWSIAPPCLLANQQDAADADALFTLLEGEVVPLFYETDENGVATEWCEHVRACLRQVVPFFNTHRMVRDYVQDAYLPAHLQSTRIEEAEEF
jgi:glycogen phosphorylase